MSQMAVAGSRTAASHHLDHAELLLLDSAVSRIVERYIATRMLTAWQRTLLEDYRANVDVLVMTLAGPARDYAEQLADLTRTVLEADADAPSAASGAHRAA